MVARGEVERYVLKSEQIGSDHAAARTTQQVQVLAAPLQIVRHDAAGGLFLHRVSELPMRIVEQELSVRDGHVEGHGHHDFRHDGFVGTVGCQQFAIDCFRNRALVIVRGLGYTAHLH
jgi:hypothetical protein